MAVRVFDLTTPQSTRVDALQAPPRRRQLRRIKQRYAIIGIVSLAIPFFAALVALGVAH
ncbi:MAG: hypothetical protein WA614_06745 [Acidimicrobiales bacterium]|jgi:hypothetical protein